jgi:16S rRNA C967 or C1407 C5-methylase (RsmB/RsmF family)
MLLHVDTFKSLQRSVDSFLGRNPVHYSRKLQQLLRAGRRTDEFSSHDLCSIASAALAVAKARKDVALAERTVDVVANSTSDLSLTEAMQAVAMSAARNHLEATRLKKHILGLTRPMSSSLPDEGDACSDGTALVSANDAANVADRLAPSSRVESLRLLEGDRSAVLRGRLRMAAPNISFVRFYGKQGLVRDEDSLALLVDGLRRRPSTFLRVTGGRFEAVVEQLLLTRSLLDSSLQKASWLPRETCPAFVAAPEKAPLQGGRDGGAGVTVAANHVQRTRQLISSLASHHVVEIQSSSSMLPSLFLDPQPGDRILDMCASPGSKTLHLLDLLGRSQGRAAKSNDSQGTVLVANDSQRWGMLSDRLEQVWTTLAAHLAVIVTSFDGKAFPMPTEPEKFTKVLVDAPCSGDGRLGRDPSQWRKWHPRQCLGFFCQQVDLLMRAIAVTAPGGRIVYSTCTMNPIENEAVVVAVLRSGLIELEEPPAFAKQHLSPGVLRWSVPTPAGGFYSSADEAEKDGDAEAVRELFCAEDDNTLREITARCCRRVMPHAQPGEEAFFVVSMKKKKRFSDNEIVAMLRSSHNVSRAEQGNKRTSDHRNHEEKGVRQPPVGSNGKRVVGSVPAVEWARLLSPAFPEEKLTDAIHRSSLQLVKLQPTSPSSSAMVRLQLLPCTALETYDWLLRQPGSRGSPSLVGTPVAFGECLTLAGVEQILSWASSGGSLMFSEQSLVSVVEVPIDVLRCLLAQSQVDLAAVAALQVHAHAADVVQHVGRDKSTSTSVAWFTAIQGSHPGAVLILKSAVWTGNAPQSVCIPVKRLENPDQKASATPKTTAANSFIVQCCCDRASKSQTAFAVNAADVILSAAVSERQPLKQVLHPDRPDSLMHLRALPEGRLRVSSTARAMK